ncbi:hypothetical protein TREMEDRAFT_65898 [Tremella mesenterica DSM 1558]|uniref:uncharacterized protein n=1 Tax=Tremella mesenterica (strain ATCC 24925 / CBS 8224 / DSM 1558 / NBRC 9311 / NRRL Y-6157 / RJB 2259-6 / UBC 559-6) TaxID=578456 RepID=UPI00032C61D6|nr:uncharacterized protein TREMEDRAFT_65898 [Tremella mesenterica DSM 1558]EIW66054.1 hypothetical protein TREMEDRAFT_65898 [Tremella mesenterica DSM 1558]
MSEAETDYVEVSLLVLHHFVKKRPIPGIPSHCSALRDGTECLMTRPEIEAYFQNPDKLVDTDLQQRLDVTINACKIIASYLSSIDCDRTEEDQRQRRNRLERLRKRVRTLEKSLGSKKFDSWNAYGYGLLLLRKSLESGTRLPYLLCPEDGAELTTHEQILSLPTEDERLEELIRAYHALETAVRVLRKSQSTLGPVMMSFKDRAPLSLEQKLGLARHEVPLDSVFAEWTTTMAIARIMQRTFLPGQLSTGRNAYETRHKRLSRLLLRIGDKSLKLVPSRTISIKAIREVPGLLGAASSAHETDLTMSPVTLKPPWPLTTPEPSQTLSSERIPSPDPDPLPMPVDHACELEDTEAPVPEPLHDPFSGTVQVPPNYLNQSTGAPPPVSYPSPVENESNSSSVLPTSVEANWLHLLVPEPGHDQQQQYAPSLPQLPDTSKRTDLLTIDAHTQGTPTSAEVECEPFGPTSHFQDPYSLTASIPLNPEAQTSEEDWRYAPETGEISF